MLLAGVNLRAFRFLRIIRSFCRVPGLKGVQTIVESLSQGTSQLMIVLMMLLFFVSALSVWAMAVFENSLKRRCVSVPQYEPKCASGFANGWSDTCALEPRLFPETVAISAG